MLPPKAITELQEIIRRDYGVSINENQAQEFGVSLLRLANAGVTALARAGDNKSSVVAREVSSLEPKTST